MKALIDDALARLRMPRPTALAIGNQWTAGGGSPLRVRSPIDGSVLAEFPLATTADVSAAANVACEAFDTWRTIPAPKRGEVIRRFGERLRQQKPNLALVVAIETGKILEEAAGEVQEMIDICDFAVGQSRQLYGRTIASERPEHRLAEQWHPLGPTGIISAFNFPVAVWAWNAALALTCGDTLVWKPSEQTPLSALACQHLLSETLAEFPDYPQSLSSVVIGGADVGQALAASPAFPLISATGSVPMGRSVAQTVAARLGRTLLELGGNNAAIVAPSADLDLALRGIVFAAAGTCGQRCTTLRRLLVHDSLAASLIERLKETFTGLPIGNPLEQGTLVGPLINEEAASGMAAALAQAAAQGGQVWGGERVTKGVPRGGAYVCPAIVEIEPNAAVVQQETFAPILYVMRYETIEEAIAMNNNVPQGLASAIFTNDVREAELFCSAVGSDCGIANVNIGTSGAEIGGAFGGEKETGGGRESGSDAWKNYMRRATNTINYSTELPLAQGIRFPV